MHAHLFEVHPISIWSIDPEETTSVWENDSREECKTWTGGPDRAKVGLWSYAWLCLLLRRWEVGEIWVHLVQLCRYHLQPGTRLWSKIPTGQIFLRLWSETSADKDNCPRAQVGPGGHQQGVLLPVVVRPAGDLRHQVQQVDGGGRELQELPPDSHSSVILRKSEEEWLRRWRRSRNAGDRDQPVQDSSSNQCTAELSAGCLQVMMMAMMIMIMKTRPSKLREFCFMFLEFWISGP